MNFQEKLFETTAELRNRAAEFAEAAVGSARARAQVAAKRAEHLKGSLGVLNQAGRELNKVARRHGSQFLKQNVSLASKVRADMTALAQATYASLQKGASQKARKPAGRRKAKAKAA